MSDEIERELVQLRALLASALGVRVDSNAAMLAATRRLRDEHEKWAAAIAETAVRLSDAGYHGQLVDSVTRLIAERDADRDSRFRWAEDAAALQAKLDLPCGSCHPCTNWSDETWRRAGRKPPHVHEWDEARAELAALRASAVDPQWEGIEDVAAAFEAEAAPTAGIALADELWPTVAPVERVEWCVFYGGTDPYHRSACIELYDDEDDAIEHVRFYVRPAGVAKRSVRRGLWEVTQAAGVSGTGTEASDG